MAEHKPGFLQLDRTAETSPRRLAILIGGGVLALLVLLWIFSEDEPSEAPSTTPVPAAPVAAPQPQPAPAAAPPAGASLAEVRLHGVMGLGDSGSAIVSTGAGPQRLVRVGRDVVPGVPLLAVAANHILVRENGREVRLSFSEDGGSAVAVATGTGQPSGPRGSEDERREAREYQAALAPYRVDGRHAGFQFRDGRMPDIFREAGLRPDDVVLRVGGLGLEDEDDVAGIPRRIRQRGDAEVEILRDGQPQTIIVHAR